MKWLHNMAVSRKCSTAKQVIAQLSNDEDHNIDDSGDDIDENDDSDEDMIAGALSQDDDDDDRALQDVADSYESESDDESSFHGHHTSVTVCSCSVTQ